MIAVLLCSPDSQERHILARDCRKRVADGSDEDLQITDAISEEEFRAFLAKEQLVHLLYYDFRKGQTVGELRRFRRQCSDAMIMLIADDSVSPLEYLKPGVSPDALLLRPINQKALEEVNREFIDSFLEKIRTKDSKDSFLVSTREEKIFIPYSSIYCFEARDKKLFVRIRDREFSFYDTIDALEKRLPNSFRRCHRSFIVNTDKIRKVDSTNSYLDLGNHIGVPISRSYRAAFKGGHPWKSEN